MEIEGVGQHLDEKMDSMKKLEAKRKFSVVVQMVGFGLRTSKMPYLSVGVD
jgi:hypothetical protein